MRQLKVYAKSGTFQHYDGKTRRYVMAAVIRNTTPNNKRNGDHSGYIYDEEGEAVARAVKILSFGVAICHPLDEFNFDLGKQVAVRKALIPSKKTRTIAESHFGMLNESKINMLLDDEAALFEKNPGAFIATYDNDKVDYIHSKEIDKCLASLTDDEQVYLKVKINTDSKRLDLIDESASWYVE